MSRDDILFATLVLFCFGAALALTRSRQTRWLAKIVLLGVALAVLDGLSGPLRAGHIHGAGLAIVHRHA